MITRLSVLQKIGIKSKMNRPSAFGQFFFGNRSSGAQIEKFPKLSKRKHYNILPKITRKQSVSNVRGTIKHVVRS